LRGGKRDGAEWVVREGVGQGEEMTQALYAHMNNKRKKKKCSGEQKGHILLVCHLARYIEETQ
jgi:hypothetical protein